jgi:hypothetical protein
MSKPKTAERREVLRVLEGKLRVVDGQGRSLDGIRKKIKILNEKGELDRQSKKRCLDVNGCDELRGLVRMSKVAKKEIMELDLRIAVEQNKKHLAIATHNFLGHKRQFLLKEMEFTQVGQRLAKDIVLSASALQENLTTLASNQGEDHGEDDDEEDDGQVEEDNHTGDTVKKENTE